MTETFHERGYNQKGGESLFTQRVGNHGVLDDISEVPQPREPESDTQETFWGPHITGKEGAHFVNSPNLFVGATRFFPRNYIKGRLTHQESTPEITQTLGVYSPTIEKIREGTTFNKNARRMIDALVLHTQGDLYHQGGDI